MSALKKRLARLCETGDPRGGMSLVMGVPGVGKTQLGHLAAALGAIDEQGSLSPTTNGNAKASPLLPALPCHCLRFR